MNVRGNQPPPGLGEGAACAHEAFDVAIYGDGAFGRIGEAPISVSPTDLQAGDLAMMSQSDPRAAS